MNEPTSGRVAMFFTEFSNFLSKWLGSHWAFSAAAFLVGVGLGTVGVDLTNIAISVATLLLGLILLNTQNRADAAMHVKLDEILRAIPKADNAVRGIESKSDDEISELRREDPDD